MFDVNDTIRLKKTVKAPDMNIMDSCKLEMYEKLANKYYKKGDWRLTPSGASVIVRGYMVPSKFFEKRNQLKDIVSNIKHKRSDSNVSK